MVRKHGLVHPAWGHRRIWVMVRRDGHVFFEASVLRVLCDEGLILPVEYQREMFGRPLVEASPVDPEAGKLLPVVTIVTNNGGSFWSLPFRVVHHRPPRAGPCVLPSEDARSERFS